MGGVGQPKRERMTFANKGQQNESKNVKNFNHVHKYDSS